MAGGYLPWLEGRGYLPWSGGGGAYLGWGEWGTYLGQGEWGTYLGQGEGYLPWPGEGYLPWPGEGVPTLARGTPAKVGTPPPPGVDGHKPMKTLPSRRTTYAGGKKNKIGITGGEGKIGR